MRAAGITDYLGDFWNCNDMLMIISTWLYVGLRLGTSTFNGNFILIKDAQFTDEHLENELILDILGKPGDLNF